MKLEKQMLVTLTDNKEYIVLTTLNIDNISYVYLVENDNFKNIKFCTQETESDRVKLTEVKDMNLRRKLLEEFTKKLIIESETNK